MHFEYTIHLDGALYGSILPIVRSFGDKNIMDYVNSFSLSMHKFFGMPLAAGIIMTNEKFYEDVFLS